MYCIDTNIIVDFTKGDEEVILRLNKLREFEEIFITPITLCELFRGVYLSRDPEIKFRIIEEFITSFPLLDFSKSVSIEFGKEYAKLKRLGKLTQEPDLMIGSFAKTYNLTLVTKDKKHFENMDIKLEVW